MEIEPLTFPGVDPKRPMIIAGPCSAESREQVLKTASELAARGVKIFRAGIWKPRTKPGGFEGIGVEGLPWMKQVKQETGMLDSHPRHCFKPLHPSSLNSIAAVKCRTGINGYKRKILFIAGDPIRHNE